MAFVAFIGIAAICAGVGVARLLFSGVRKVVPRKRIIVSSASLLICFALLPLPRAQAAGPMVIDSYEGPITQNEINSFKAYIQTVKPVVWGETTNMNNEYAQGKSGEAIKAMGLMYELTGDTEILDRMIYFCDVVLSQRNDILPAPYGQRIAWTSTIAPVWPGSPKDPAGADSANGDHVGHLAFCARLILQTPSSWDKPVPIGDEFGHGATYRERAATFLTQADYVVNEFFFPYLLDFSHANKYYFSTMSPYKTGEPLPWNQQMMITYGFQNLAVAHELAGDNPALVAKYDRIVQTNIDWFFKDNTVKKVYTNSAGNTTYNWGYAPTSSGGEDSNHASLDVAGFYRAYLSGRYGITSEMMKPFANMYADVMIRGPKDFAGRVDGKDGTGHAAPTTYARSGNIYLADLRPDMYYDLAYADLASKTTTGLDMFSRFMWAKNERYKKGYSIEFNPAPRPSTSAQTVSLSTSLSGAAIRYTTDGSMPTPTHGTLYTGPVTVSKTATVKAVAYTAATTSPVSSGKYTVAPTAPSNLTAAAVSSSQIGLSWTSSDGGGGALTYDVYRGAERIGSTAATTYNDTGLTASTAYSYTVKAKDAAGNESAASNSVTATTFSDTILGISEWSYTINSGDITLQMQLNGDTLASIRDNERFLTAGTDYVNNGTSVTLKKTYLGTLAIGRYPLTFSFGSGKQEVLTLKVAQGSLTLNKTYFASSIWNSSYSEKYAFDSNASTRWSAAKGQVADQFLGVNFGSELEFNKVVLKEITYPRVNAFVLQASNDGVHYSDIPGTEDTSIGAQKTITFDPVTAQYVRLWMYSTKLESGASKEPTINEFEVYNDVDTEAPVLVVPGDMTVEATGERTPVSIGTATSPDEVTITSDAPADYPLGTTIVTWTATKGNGLSSTAKQAITVVDTRPPVITVETTPLPNGNGWHNRDVTVHLAVYDSGSGLTSVTPDIVITAEGANQTVTGAAADKAGNQASATATIHLDKTMPATLAALTPFEPEGANGWYAHPVTMQLTGTDVLSGVERTEYSTDGGTTWQPYTEPVTIREDGRYTVSYRSTDKAGNQEQPKSIRFQLDTTAPVIAVSSPAAGRSYPDAGDITFQYTTTDGLAGVDGSRTSAALNGQPIANGAVVPLYALPLGVNTIQATAGDSAGNVQTVTVTFATYADLDSMKALVTRFNGMSWIDNAGIADSLQSKLQQGNLKALMNEVRAQSGKHISKEAADYLLRDAQAILDALTTMVAKYSGDHSIGRPEVARELLDALKDGNLKAFAKKVSGEAGKQIAPEAASAMLQGLQPLLKD